MLMCGGVVESTLDDRHRFCQEYNYNTSLYSWFKAIKSQLMAASWIHSWFLFLLDHLAWSVHRNTVCLVVAWQSVDGNWLEILLFYCFVGAWLNGWESLHSFTEGEIALTLNIPWGKSCSSTVLFELRELLNNVFNSCIDFPPTARKSQELFLGF